MNKPPSKQSPNSQAPNNQSPGIPTVYASDNTRLWHSNQCQCNEYSLLTKNSNRASPSPKFHDESKYTI